MCSNTVHGYYANMDEQRRIRLDSHSLRALAHPLRSRLLSALRAFGPATATMLAQRLGTNSGATSYHLRQLADAGLVEEDVEQGQGRERWWRSAHDSTSWSDTDFLDDPGDRAASDWLYGHHVRLTTRWVEDWLEGRHEWPVEWQGAADSSDQHLRLTPEQLRALMAELSAVVERYQREADPGAPGTERIQLIWHAFPQPAPRI